MSARAPSAAAEAPAAGSGPLVVARALPAPDDGLRRVSWPLTICRLALEPGLHPWSARWRLYRRGPVAALAVALLLLLLFAASGCSSAPRHSLRSSASSPPPSRGLRCESVLVSQEIQVPPEGELADVRLTIEDLPQTTGKLRVLVRRPRFEASLELATDQRPEFDKVLELSTTPGQRSLTVVLSRPRRARDDWPRRECKACRLDIELTGLFGAREALGAFFDRAMQQAAAIDAGFSAQAPEPATRPDGALREAAEAMISEGKRCGVALEPALRPALAALARLDGARALLYGEDPPGLPDAAAVRHAWDLATDAMDGVMAASARGAGWPASLRPGSAGRLAASALQLEAVSQVASLRGEDRGIAARWIGLALAGDPAVQKRRLAALPPIRDLDDAQARLAWVNVRAGSVLPIPGLSRGAAIRLRDWAVPIRGKRCIGPGGAAPVRNAEEDAASVGRLLGGDRQRLRIARAADIPQVREALRRSGDLLCEGAQPDVSELFRDLADKDLGPVAARLEEIFTEADPRREHDEITRAVLARASRLLCGIFDAEGLQQRLGTVAGYKVFVEGGTRILEVLPQPLICGSQLLTPREIRRRLRAGYRAALDAHALKDRLCPVRGGKCPDEVAASVRKIFGLHRPELAAPAPGEGRRLDFPPAFGFSDEWVQKLDRCAQEACEALSRLRGEAPAGQFEGAVCQPREPGVERPQEVTLASPEAPSSLTLASCDPHAGVRLTLRRLRDAGTLVAIASAHPFRYGSENVTRQGRHPQLGRIYERVADLTDSGDVSRRADSVFEVALTPTVANQVFWFFSLRRRDY
jgi:hypothetical protein